MRILYYDCFSGISGDMNVGALLDLGVDKEYLIKQLSLLNIDEEYEIVIKTDSRKGVTGTKFDVVLKEHIHEHNHLEEHQHGDEHHHIHNHEEEHEHEHEHSHGDEHIHNHEHEHSHEAEHNHEHQHGSYKDIKNLIQKSSLSENVKKLSLDIFSRVAVAEAKIHGKDIEEVHFHEVGAVDSIIDIVGAAICIDYLKVENIFSSPVQVGAGFVKCAHGLFPVPAPAVTEILKGIPIKTGAVPFETTTPTGAAILAQIVGEFTNKKEFIVNKIGYGIGNRDTEIPNVLRVILADINDTDNSNGLPIQKNSELEPNNTQIVEDKNFMLECNIDDMNPEFYDYIMEKLFSIGASDVYLTPIIMKKSRPAVKLSVLCNANKVDFVKGILLKETTTLGIRKYEVEKTMLKRDSAVIKTIYGDVRVKSSYYNNEIIKWKAEYDDCKRLALENKVSINEIYSEVQKQIK